MELKKLQEIAKDWEKDFKGNLLSDLLDYTDILTFIDIITDEWIPTWQEENTENANLYTKYKIRLENLDRTKLSKEYDTIRHLLILANA